MEITPEIIIIASMVIYIAEVYGAIIGGGGFLVQPVLLALGMPPAMAVAHDIFACQGTNIGGFYVFNKTKNIPYHIIKWWLPGLAVGSILGVRFLISIPAWLFEKIIGTLAILALIYVFVIKKETGLKKAKNPRRVNKAYTIIISLFIGTYLGFSGAGAGVMTSLILVSLFKTTFIQSLGARKVLHMIPMLFASISYIYFGLIYWPLAISMLLAAVLAGATGSRLSLILGDRILKIIFGIAITGFATWLLIK